MTSIKIRPPYSGLQALLLVTVLLIAALVAWYAGMDGVLRDVARDGVRV